MPLPLSAEKNKTRQLRIIYAGGTLGMLPGQQGLEPGSNLAARLLPQLPSGWLDKLDVQLSFCELTPLLDSSAMQARHWLELAAQLLAEEQHYAGFVLIQGTDTLAWTSSALHCLLTNFSRPLLLTAAQLPLGAPNSDALPNFMYAVTQAINLAESSQKQPTKQWLAFNQQLLPLQASRKYHSQAKNAFIATSQPQAAKHWPPQGQLKPQELRQLANQGFAPKILCLPLTPSLNDAWLSQLLHSLIENQNSTTQAHKQLDGLIIAGLGSGNSPRLPRSWQQLHKLHQQGVPLGLISQCWQGGVNQNYAAAAALTAAGIQSLGAMTPEYAEARLVCLLALHQLGKISTSQVVDYWPDPKISG